MALFLHIKYINLNEWKDMIDENIVSMFGFKSCFYKCEF